MAVATLEQALGRDRLIVLTALLLLTAIAASYVGWLAVNMNATAPASASAGMADVNMAADSPSGGLADMTVGAR